MDFFKLLKESDEDEGKSINPFSGKSHDGRWVEGMVDISSLNDKFGEFDSIHEMISATESEGLKLYFQWLKDKGILK